MVARFITNRIAHDNCPIVFHLYRRGMETIWKEQSSEPPAAPCYQENKTRERPRKAARKAARREGKEVEQRKEKERVRGDRKRKHIYLGKKEMFGKKNREGEDIWETESTGDVLSVGPLYACVCVCVCVCVCPLAV